jgi:hypothetical protein
MTIDLSKSSSIELCGHSACTQHFVDTGSAECLEKQVDNAVVNLSKDELVVFVQSVLHTLYWDMGCDEDTGEDTEEWNLDKEWEVDTPEAIAEKLPRPLVLAIKSAMGVK